MANLSFTRGGSLRPRGIRPAPPMGGGGSMAGVDVNAAPAPQINPQISPLSGGADAMGGMVARPMPGMNKPDPGQVIPGKPMLGRPPSDFGADGGPQWGGMPPGPNPSLGAEPGMGGQTGMDQNMQAMQSLFGQPTGGAMQPTYGGFSGPLPGAGVSRPMQPMGGATTQPFNPRRGFGPGPR